MKTPWAVAAALLGTVAALRAAGPANAFAGRESVAVRSIAGLEAGATVWFRVAKDHRTLASGSVAAGIGGVLTLPVALPEMKPGVALPLEWTLKLGSDGGRPLCEVDPLWAFAERPFEPGHNPAAPRAIRLYDPLQRTAAALASIDVPFEALTRVEAIEAETDAVIVVGEGVSLEDERGLWDALMAAVARGNTVLLLAPTDGALSPPENWSRLTAGAADDVLRGSPVGGTPYKLDLAGWPANAISRKRFRLAGVRDAAVFEITADSGSDAVGWDVPASGGRFRACGLDLISQWEQTPAARWLLAEMLCTPAPKPPRSQQRNPPGNP